jgi:hypothetical protein
MDSRVPVDIDKRNRAIDQVDILFEASLRTFDWSVERSRHFDLKASIILAFLGILLLPSVEIYGWSNKLLGLRLAPILLIFAGVVFCLFAVLPTLHLEHPKLSVLKDDYDRDKGPTDTKLELFRHYENAAKRNENVGNRKTCFIQAALTSSFFSFVMILVQYLFRGSLYGR